MVYNTIEEALYLGMRNDVSFLLYEEMNLYEHQSSYNPNMPLRQLQYVSSLYEKYLKQNHLNKYSSSQLELPVPRLVVFYNGTDEAEDEVILRLSDSFRQKKELADIEVTVRMLNINLEHNRELLDSCKPLFEYAWLVERARRYKAEDRVDPFEIAIREIPENFVIHDWILAHKAEVKDMFLTEYDEAEAQRLFELDGYRRGEAEGIKQGIEQGMENQLALLDALRKGIPEEQLLSKGFSPESIQKTREYLKQLGFQ